MKMFHSDDSAWLYTGLTFTMVFPSGDTELLVDYYWSMKSLISFLRSSTTGEYWTH